MKKTLLMRLTFIGILLFFGVQATVAQDTLLSDSTQRVNCAQAQLFLQHYRFEAALDALNACFEQDTSNTEYLRKKALCYYKLGRFQEAEATYYAILETDSNNVNALNQLGVIYSNQSNYRAAVEQYERLSAIDTANSYYHKVLGSLFYKLKVIDYAMGHDQLALELNPNDVEAIAHLTKIYQSMEQYELADELIAKGLELDSSNATLYHYQLKSAYRQHNYAGVLESAQYLMQLEQDTSAYLLKMMGIAHFHTGDYALSASLLEKVVDNDKAKEQLHYYIGLAYREMGDAETSEKHFEKPLKTASQTTFRFTIPIWPLLLKSRGIMPKPFAHTKWRIKVHKTRFCCTIWRAITMRTTEIRKPLCAITKSTWKRMIRTMCGLKITRNTAFLRSKKSFTLILIRCGSDKKWGIYS